MNNIGLRMSVCQYKIDDNKTINISKANEQINLACEQKADIIVLPECFVCPYDINIFEKNSEPINDLFDPEKSPATYMLRESSFKYPNVYIVGGSIIESEYNNKLEKTQYF